MVYLLQYVTYLKFWTLTEMHCFISANPVSQEALSATYVHMYVHVYSIHVSDVHTYIHTMSTSRVLQCTCIISPPGTQNGVLIIEVSIFQRFVIERSQCMLKW